MIVDEQLADVKGSYLTPQEQLLEELASQLSIEPATPILEPELAMEPKLPDISQFIAMINNKPFKLEAQIGTTNKFTVEFI